MIHLVATVMSFLLVSPAHAAATCTAAPTDKWLPAETMRQRIAADGYRIGVFKTDGDCYEIYGRDKDGRRVEIYFDPVSGAIVKSSVR